MGAEQCRADGCDRVRPWWQDYCDACSSAPEPTTDANQLPVGVNNARELLDLMRVWREPDGASARKKLLSALRTWGGGGECDGEQYRAAHVAAEMLEALAADAVSIRPESTTDTPGEVRERARELWSQVPDAARYAISVPEGTAAISRIEAALQAAEQRGAQRAMQRCARKAAFRVTSDLTLERVPPTLARDWAEVFGGVSPEQESGE